MLRRPPAKVPAEPAGCGMVRPGSAPTESSPQCFVPPKPPGPRFDLFAALAATGAGGGPVSGDQAVFTSVRGPAGQGYQIAAASAGVRPDEKAEMTLRSPSHASLCNPEAESQGLATYRLASGRQCVAYSCHAGAEHSGRGGYRVYTQLVLLNPRDYRQFGGDPFALRDALHGVVGVNPPTEFPRFLDRLHLTVDARESGARDQQASPEAVSPEAVCAAAGALLNGRSLVVVERQVPDALAAWVLAALPLAARTELALSSGLRFARARKMNLTLLDRNGQDLVRALAGHEVDHIDAQKPPAPVASPWDDWLRLADRWCRQGRLAELHGVSSLLTTSPPPEGLSRIAALCADLDRAASATGDELESLRHRYTCHNASSDAEARLVRVLVNTLESRPTPTVPQA